VFAASIPDKQLFFHLYNETMVAGDPGIMNNNVIVGSTANKSDISTLESVLPHGEVLVFQLKSKHGAPSTQLSDST
jgi:hypothetical protein